MRLDKYVSETSNLSRSEAGRVIRSGRVLCNGMAVKQGNVNINENVDEVILDGKQLNFQKTRYYMYHKPAGLITATEDPRHRTVMDDFSGLLVRGLFPVGRLDKDTEGLLLVTNDGPLAHRLLSPRGHVPKKYEVHFAGELTNEGVEALQNGMNIGERRLTAPAKVEVVSAQVLYLTITEGKFHQVKRMMEKIGCPVLYLKRWTFGPLELDTGLKPGEFRELSFREAEKLKEYAHV